MIVGRYKSGYFCTMNRSFYKNYKALSIGGVITIGLAIVLTSFGGFSYYAGLPRTVHILIDIFNLVFCWLLISFLINKFPLYQILGVISLLVLALLAEYNLAAHNNPITIPLLILFWLGVAYLILPQFFKKYKIIILLIYGLVISYYFIYGNMTNYAAEHRSSFSKFLLIPLPVFAALWFYEQWRWLKMLQADKAKAELALLKSQINPHFFFNTLNNLYGLVIEKSEKAPEVVLKLSDMMRYTIYEGKEDLVLLKNEISYLENYIELHKIRYHKKVEIVFTHDIEEGLKVAPLLFIILLENAFKHGVEKMRESAFIHLHLQSQGKQLFFRIENNFDESTSKQNPGIGLENLKKRLEYLYPNQYQLVIEAKESIYKVQLNLELNEILYHRR